MDIPCAPMLVDITINGKTVKAVAQPTKQAFLYVLNRETGEPIWPIEERPVPKGDVPGEWYSPTQPFPSKPPAFDNQGISSDSLINFTPELHAEAEKLVSQYRIGPLFTPPSVSTLGGPLASLTSPGSIGGANWPGDHTILTPTRCMCIRKAESPRWGLFPPQMQSCRTWSTFRELRGDASGREAHGGGSLATRPGPAATEGEGGDPLTVRGMPLLKPPMAASRRSIWTRANSPGRSRTGKLRTTFATILRWQASPFLALAVPVLSDADDKDFDHCWRSRLLHNAIRCSRRNAARV